MFENRRMREMAIDRLAGSPVRGVAHPRVGTGPTLMHDIDLIEVMEVSR